MTTPPQPTTAGERDQTDAGWQMGLLAHEGWRRKVILARTGEPQAVDEMSGKGYRWSLLRN